jgi:flagellin
MALTIATNSFALATQNALSTTQTPLANAMEQLSTGLKINTAADDAAGLAIATRMQLQINGYAQDVNNANNGVDFAQTAEGALTGMTNNLQRIYELANQAASYNTSSDRADMNDEVQQLIAQLNSTVSQTEYNGSTFLNQAFSANFQTGNEVGQTINISTQNVAPNAFGVQTSRNDFSNSALNLAAIASSVGSMTLDSSGLAASTTLAGVKIAVGASISASLLTNNSLNVISRINQYTAQTNITAFSFGNAYVATNIQTAGVASGIDANFLTINGIAIGSATATAGTSGAVASALVTAINAKTTETGVTAVVLGSTNTGTANGYSIGLVNTTGAAITVAVSTAAAGAVGADAEFFGNVGGSIAAGQNGQVVFSAPLGDTSTTVNLASLAAVLGFGSSSTSIALAGDQSINNIDVTTVGGANLAILSVEQGINTMNNAQAYLGAVVNRFNSAITELQSDSTNITAARSSFMDADYAAASTNLTNAMITEQAGIAMLSQANTLPQQVLSLLPKT